MPRSIFRADREGRSLAGRIASSLFSLVFLAMGLGWSWLVGQSLYRSARTYTWPRTECLILASGTDVRSEGDQASETTNPYRFTVRYRYHQGERTFESDHSGFQTFNKAAPARRLVAQFPAGSTAPCWVDPVDPASATLHRPSLWVGLVLLFPLAFLAGGAGRLYLTWRKPRSASALPSSGQRAISSAADGSGWLGGTGCIVAFLSLFVLVGLGVMIFFARPALQNFAARSWRETPCTILHSEVLSHPGDDSTTYSVEVLYSYEVDGQEHQSDRYRFLGGSSSGSVAKKAAVARYPAGSRAVCYVNPADPDEAVLYRGFESDYVAAIIPLIFILAGGGAIVFVVRGARGTRVRRASRTPRWVPDGAVPSPPATAPRLATWPVVGLSGPIELKPGSTPLGKFLGFLFAALFWNGITGFFVRQIFLERQAGGASGCNVLFPVPFVLVGLLLIWGVLYQLLALANPRLHLTLSAATLPVGGSAQLDWRFSGRARRVSRLRITIEGREEATYRRGTRTSTDSSTFATLEVFSTDSPAAIPAGRTGFTIPSDTMHSFEGRHNKIAWKLKAHGEIRRWPDVVEEYELMVVPQGVSR